MAKLSSIRPMQKHETSILVSLIREMAEFEKLLEEVKIKEEILQREIFELGRVKALFIEDQDEIIGYCLYFFNFSSFMGRSGLYIEDIYIKDKFRGKGYGKKAFAHLEGIAKEENCARMEWTCLHWNKKAIDFYNKEGAKQMNDWILYRKVLL